MIGKNELKQVTRQTCLVYRAVRNLPNDWLTVRMVVGYTGVNARTVRGIMSALADEGILVKYPAHGGFRYKTKVNPSADAQLVSRRILAAEKVFGLTEAA